MVRAGAGPCVCLWAANSISTARSRRMAETDCRTTPVAARAEVSGLWHRASTELARSPQMEAPENCMVVAEGVEDGSRCIRLPIILRARSLHKEDQARLRGARGRFI